VQLCGRKPTLISKRRALNEGFNDVGDSDPLDKIIGGSYATYGEIPWQVNIYANGTHRCGGAIINAFWVLTTAMCVFPRYTGTITLVLGDHLMSRDEQGQQTFQVEHVYIHDGFAETFHNDTALLKIAPINGNGIQFNDYVQPVCLPETGELPAINASLTLSGWGETETYSIRSSDVLKKMVVPFVDYAECSRIFNDSHGTQGLLCAGRPGGSSDICLTDMGGPATFKSGDVNILAGLILASSISCTAPAYTIILTSVEEHLSWIRLNIQDHSNGTAGVIPGRTG
ncbi:unnamed protein product, partial [Candidula unifasciata]